MKHIKIYEDFLNEAQSLNENEIPASVKKLMGDSKVAKLLQGWGPETLANAVLLAVGATYDYRGFDKRIAGTKETTKAEREKSLKEVVAILSRLLKDKSYLEAEPWRLNESSISKGAQTLNENRLPAEVLAIAKKFQLGSRVISKDASEARLPGRIDNNKLASAINAALSKNRIQLQFTGGDASSYIKFEFNPYIQLYVYITSGFYRQPDGGLAERSSLWIQLGDTTGNVVIKKSEMFGGETYEEIADIIAKVFRDNSGVIAELQAVQDSTEVPASVRKLMNDSRVAKILQGKNPETMANAVALAIGATYDYRGFDKRIAGTKETTIAEREEKLKAVIDILNTYLRDKSYLEAAPWRLD
jgi:hypothetical protein